MSRRVKVEPPFVESPSSAGIYRTQLLFIEPVHTWVAECVLEPLMPPPVAASPSPVLNFPAFSHSRSISLFLTLFFFHFRPPPLSHSSPFFSRQTMLFHSSGFVRHLPLCFTASCFHFLLFPFSSRTSFLPPFFFLIPLQITSRAAAPVRRQYRQMRTFPLIISLMQSALTKRWISNNYSWNDIKGWALLFFFFFISPIEQRAPPRVASGDDHTAGVPLICLLWLKSSLANRAGKQRAVGVEVEEWQTNTIPLREQKCSSRIRF